MHCELRIRGWVQGVAYRATLADQARRLGLRGWVRNRRDGSVEALVVGAPEAVEALLAWAAIGPPHARVAGIDRRDFSADEPSLVGPGFEIRPTA